MRYAVLLAISAAVLGARPAAPQAQAAVVNVQLSSFKFTPRTIVLDRGRPYVMRFTNASRDGHDFSAPEFFAASRIAPKNRRSITEGQVEVHPGKTDEVHLTAPGVPGRYKVKCTHSFHKLFGMSGTIIVR